MTLQSVTRPTPTLAQHVREITGEDCTLLTRRERAVLELVTQGYPDQEIADRLSLSRSAITTYLPLVYRKIAVSSRAEAIQWGVHHGAGC